MDLPRSGIELDGSSTRSLLMEPLCRIRGRGGAAGARIGGGSCGEPGTGGGGGGGGRINVVEDTTPTSPDAAPAGGHDISALELRLTAGSTAIHGRPRH